MRERKQWTRGAAWLPVLLWAVSWVSPSAAQTPTAVPSLAPAPVAPPPPLTPSPAAPTRFLPRVAAHLETTLSGHTYAVLTINEADAATIRTDAGGYSPEQRANLTVQRLVNLLQGGLRPDEIAAQPDTKPQWEVSARGGPLLLATAAEAIAHGQTPKELAEGWAKTLQRLLSVPPLTLSVNHLIVPYGETRSVKIGGAVLPADVQVQVNNASVGKALYDPATRTLTVQGLTTGSDIVTVSPAPGVGGAPLSLPVTVMRYAGEVAPAVTVEVTGNPVPPEMVMQAAYLGLTQAVRLAGGAEIASLPLPIPSTPLATGGQTSQIFPVRLAGTDLLPVTGSTCVTVLNTPLTTPTPSVLFYSNNPERVERAQTLFTGRLHPAATVRLDFHHQNRSGQVLAFHVDLVNNESVPARVQVIAGLSLPGADTVQVGRRAGAAFLKNLNADAGLVLTVPAHGSLPLVTQRFAPEMTLSGLMQIQNLSPVFLSLSVRADADVQTLTSALWRTYMDGDGGDALAAPSDEPSFEEDAVSSPDVFLRPQVTLAGNYVVGGRWSFISLGDPDTLRARTGDLRLSGNYGADCDITLTLSNPTSIVRTIGIYFAPVAGPAAGVFQVNNGPVLEFDPLDPPGERQLDQVTLAPGQTQVVHLHTIPLNGSAYPAQVVARALDVPALPAPVLPAPPIAAATSSPAMDIITGKAGR